MEMIWFYERTLLELIIAMVKNKKKNAARKIQCQSKLVLCIT